MHLNGFEDLEQLVASVNINAFIELVNEIVNLPSDEANRQHH